MKAQMTFLTMLFVVSPLFATQKFMLSLSAPDQGQLSLVEDVQNKKWLVQRRTSEGKIKSKKIDAGLAQIIRSDAVDVLWTAQYKDSAPTKCKTVGTLDSKIDGDEKQLEICVEHQKAYPKFSTMLRRMIDLIK